MSSVFKIRHTEYVFPFSAAAGIACTDKRAANEINVIPNIIIYFIRILISTKTVPKLYVSELSRII